MTEEEQRELSGDGKIYLICAGMVRKLLYRGIFIVSTDTASH